MAEWPRIMYRWRKGVSSSSWCNSRRTSSTLTLLCPKSPKRRRWEPVLRLVWLWATGPRWTIFGRSGWSERSRWDCLAWTQIPWSDGSGGDWQTPEGMEEGYWKEPELGWCVIRLVCWEISEIRGRFGESDILDIGGLFDFSESDTRESLYQDATLF